jgi:hypothetical protein
LLSYTVIKNAAIYLKTPLLINKPQPDKTVPLQKAAGTKSCGYKKLRLQKNIINKSSRRKKVSDETVFHKKAAITKTAAVPGIMSCQ